ncbi:MAG TPA: hypothetical protein VMP13_02550 [Acidimicrobiia bacterium]|nr:hypothetical protein [Acidimicrobiia bacterium]
MPPGGRAGPQETFGPIEGVDRRLEVDPGPRGQAKLVRSVPAVEHRGPIHPGGGQHLPQLGDDRRQRRHPLVGQVVVPEDVGETVSVDLVLLGREEDEGQPPLTAREVGCLDQAVVRLDADPAQQVDAMCQSVSNQSPKSAGYRIRMGHDTEEVQECRIAQV